jgi:hypothetical protein
VNKQKLREPKQVTALALTAPIRYACALHPRHTRVYLIVSFSFHLLLMNMVWYGIIDALFSPGNKGSSSPVLSSAVNFAPKHPFLPTSAPAETNSSADKLWSAKVPQDSHDMSSQGDGLQRGNYSNERVRFEESLKVYT